MPTPSVSSPAGGTTPSWIDVGSHSTPSVGQVIEDISAPGASSVFAQVFSSANVARGPWVPITLDTLGHGSFTADFVAPGDYLNVIAGSQQTPTAQGWSAQAA